MKPSGIKALERAMFYVSGLIVADVFEVPQTSLGPKVIMYTTVFVFTWVSFYILERYLDL